MSRGLTEPEQRLITTMLSVTGSGQAVLNQLDSARVVEMSDGEMGSLKFVRENSNERRLGQAISEAEFIDEDGVTVSVVINLDEDGYLYELDVWKVDFSPLKRWPNTEDIVVKK